MGSGLTPEARKLNPRVTQQINLICVSSSIMAKRSQGAPNGGYVRVSVMDRCHTK